MLHFLIVSVLWYHMDIYTVNNSGYFVLLLSHIWTVAPSQIAGINQADLKVKCVGDIIYFQFIVYA